MHLVYISLLFLPFSSLFFPSFFLFPLFPFFSFIVLSSYVLLKLTYIFYFFLFLFSFLSTFSFCVGISVVSLSPEDAVFFSSLLQQVGIIIVVRVDMLAMYLSYYSMSLHILVPALLSPLSHVKKVSFINMNIQHFYYVADSYKPARLRPPAQHTRRPPRELQRQSHPPNSLQNQKQSNVCPISPLLLLSFSCPPLVYFIDFIYVDRR